MTSVCFYFQIHQPYRVKRYGVFSIGNDSDYFNAEEDHDTNNLRVARKVSLKSYEPTTALLLELMRKHPEFKISFSISGIALEQLLVVSPKTIENIKELVAMGRTELLAETYYHSLSFFYSKKEFEAQVQKHTDLLLEVFGVTPRVFRNTELAYSNELGLWAEMRGYKGILAEGWDPVLEWRSPGFVYSPKGAHSIALLLKNYKLSDDIAFRFGSKVWEAWPLTAEKFASWIHSLSHTEDVVNLFMDFETFGEHQWESTGIFNFLRQLPLEVLKDSNVDFKTPSEVIDSYTIRDEIDMPSVVTWADTDRDLTAWTGNAMQKNALKAVYEIEQAVYSSNNLKHLDTWRKLQTSDHFYYMCTKWSADGDVHSYFSPYSSPHDAFTHYMNALTDLTLRTRDGYEASS